MSPISRSAAALIACLAWLGLAFQVSASRALLGTLAATLWKMLLYFTVIANLLVAFVFTGVALTQAMFPRLLAFVTSTILLVGIVYALLLRGLLELSGGAWRADLLLHTIVPILVPLYWIVFVPKGTLRRHDPLLWMLLPLVYYAYALTRGALEGTYPYPFMNLEQIGWWHTGVYALAMAVGLLATGAALVWLDRQIADRNKGAMSART